jgi:hypothetical protein
LGDAGSCIADFVFRQMLSKGAALPWAIHLRFLLPHVTVIRGEFLGRKRTPLILGGELP